MFFLQLRVVPPRLIVIILSIFQMMKSIGRYEPRRHGYFSLCHCMLVACNSHSFFNSHEMEEGLGQFVDPMVGVQNILIIM
jgi:hypothetical protein